MYGSVSRHYIRLWRVDDYNTLTKRAKVDKMDVEHFTLPVKNLAFLHLLHLLTDRLHTFWGHKLKSRKFVLMFA